MSIKVRFAPSPTGFLHVGGLRTALYNYLYAKKQDGKIVLRIEDTDQTRKIDNAVENLRDSFNHLDIHFDEGPYINGDNGPYYQSQRLSIYKDHIQILLKNGSAYPCFCTSMRLDDLRKKLTAEKKTIKYDRHCLGLSKNEIQSRMQTEQHVIRMKVPDEEEAVFFDVVRERVAIRCEELDDQVLIKSDEYPTYHFANVVDDHLMGITHVMRGEEWLSSTPKHVLLYQFFDWKLPKFIHLPLLLNPDKSKLSKRQGDITVEDYLQKGYLSEAIINFVALLGWHPKNDQEIFSLTELEKEFSLKRIHKSGAVFDIEKLNWMNSQYLMHLPLNQIAEKAKPYFDKDIFDLSDSEKYLKTVDNARCRVNTLAEIPAESKMFYGEVSPSAENSAILKTENAKALLSRLFKQIQFDSELDGESFKQLLMETGKEMGIKGKELFSPARIALYGDSKGPDIPIIFSILGRAETIHRLEKYI